MRRAALLLSLALVAPLPTSNVAHGGSIHEDRPTDIPVLTWVQAICEWEGTWYALPGISTTEPRHAEFDLIGARVHCVDTDPLDGHDYDDSFDVLGTGTTDGDGNHLGHGETRASGWSHSGPSWGDESGKCRGPSANKTPIALESWFGSTDALGWSKFSRSGHLAAIWGCVTWTPPWEEPWETFIVGHLEFEPYEPEDPNDVQVFINYGSLLIGQAA